MRLRICILKATAKALGLFFFVYLTLIIVWMKCVHFDQEQYSHNSLQIIESWKNQTLGKSKFIPYLVDSQGIQQPAISHPPFSYYFLFLLNKVVGSNYHFICNLLILIISGIFIYLTIVLLLRKHAQKEFSWLGILGMTIYLTHPTVIEYQLMSFHPDIFANVFLIIANYIILKAMMKERFHSPKYLILYSIAIFLLSYSSWFGVIYSSLIILLGLFNLRRAYRFIPFLVLSFLITSLTVLLILGQYSIVEGWKNVFYYFKQTYIHESFLAGNIRKTGIQIIFQIFKNLGSLILILMLIILRAILAGKRKFVFTKHGYQYLVISLIPVVIYAIVFVQYFQNEYTSLYFIAPLSVAITIWVEKINKNEPNQKEIVKLALLIVLTNLVLFGLYQYF